MSRSKGNGVGSTHWYSRGQECEAIWRGQESVMGGRGQESEVGSGRRESRAGKRGDGNGVDSRNQESR